MKFITLVLFVSFVTLASASEFNKLSELYDGLEVDADGTLHYLKKPSAWTGKCYTARDPDTSVGAFFFSYDLTDSTFAKIPHVSMYWVLNKDTDMSDVESLDDSAIGKLFEGRRNLAVMVRQYKEDAAWVQGRGFEVFSIRPEFDDGGILKIHTLTTCIGDEKICAERAISLGRWRHCLFDKKRM